MCYRDPNIPAWLLPLLRGSIDLIDLPDNWNSYGAQPIDPELVMNALNQVMAVLEESSTPPWIVPMSDGGIQSEWYKDRGELELVVDPEGSISGYWCDPVNGDEIEFSAPLNISQIRLLLSCLK